MVFAVLRGALFGVWSAPGAAQGTAHIDAAILARSNSPKPGTTTRIAVRMVPRPGWHGYWINPGDSGLSVEAKWTAPDGVTVGELRHPAPALLELVGLASYVHKGAFTLLTDLKLDGDIAPGKIGRAHVRTPVTNAHLVCRLLLENNKDHTA